jgi:hypothetical protein
MLVGEKVNLKRLLWGIIPSLISIVSIYFYLRLPETEKTKFITEAFGTHSPILVLNNVVIAISFMTFMTMGLLKIYKIEKEAKDVFSNTYQIKIGFLKELFYLFLVLGFITFPSSIIAGNIITYLILVPVSTNIYIFYICYQSYHNHVLFTKEDFEKYTQDLMPLNTYRIESIKIQDYLNKRPMTFTIQ